MALPLLVMLIVGMVSAGIAYNHQLGLTHSAREAGRYAATLPVTNFVSMNDWLIEIATRALEDASGSLGPGVAGHYICVAYVHPNGAVATDQTTRRVDDGGVVTYSSNPCFADGRPNDERRVQVRVARDTDFSVVFFSSILTLDSEAVNRFEAAGSL
jgi:Flp pilus assembly protein TadG